MAIGIRNQLESIPPEGENSPVVQRVKTWIDNVKKEFINYNFIWIDPHCCSLNLENEVVLEWWFSDRKLSLYFDAEICFIIVNGLNMHDGVLWDIHHFIKLWKWLHPENPPRFI